MTVLKSAASKTATRLLLLAPPAYAQIGGLFRRCEVNSARYRARIAELQRLRGSVYLEDGAITSSQLSSDGRHIQAADEESWHLLGLDSSDSICGCVRYHSYDNSVSFRQLGIRNSALALSDKWGPKLRFAVEAELARAQQRDLRFCELGGWAIDRSRRCTTEALRLAASAFGLAQLLGGALGITTATKRHSSSAILRRIGGRPLQWRGSELPSYYDPQYGCDMEILSFDSVAPVAGFRDWIDEMGEALLTASILFRAPQFAFGERMAWSGGHPVAPVLPGA